MAWINNFFGTLQNLFFRIGRIALPGLLIFGLTACESTPIVIELATPEAAAVDTPVVLTASTPTTTVTIEPEATDPHTLTPPPTAIAVVVTETPVATATAEPEEIDTPLPPVTETPTEIPTSIATIMAPTPTLLRENPTVAPTVTPDILLIIDQVVAEINRSRPDNQCLPVTINPILTLAAQTHSQDMAENEYFSHTGSDGSSPWDRLERVGYEYSVAAENIAVAYATPEEVVVGWLESPGHRENMVNCDFQEVGIGYAVLIDESGLANSDIYWTLVLASP